MKSYIVDIVIEFLFTLRQRYSLAERIAMVLLTSQFVPALELKSSSLIFWFRAIWLRSKRLPFGAMRIGNDLEMSGVL